VAHVVQGPVGIERAGGSGEHPVRAVVGEGTVWRAQRPPQRHRRRVSGRPPPRGTSPPGREVPPDEVPLHRSHEEIIRRILDAVALDRTVRAWLFDQVWAGRISFEQLVIVLKGKSLRGSITEDSWGAHLLSAMARGAGVVTGQEKVGKKSARSSRYRWANVDAGRKHG